ncbi:hypothetical protein HBO03_24810 [Pseudomonas sp. WS 5086]|uniref:Uncharacterized protein n=2 Tax=Pseudomonas TaxID=286 RepID=A0ABX7JT31_9PSED|nr:hypothetical protein [Pseudomonas hygromyciniae]MBN0980326.1 hypothetical protein [Pseudomonas hygromyciniae]NMX94367.1 hypothetical protein [Pseudomonas sp. WS 5086]NMY47853.1 hypothetical protein [Pseudomonas sp. WS 5027]QSB38536.1 hypothetical protein JTY93_20095 [Pseudomonas hygromyciniae]
MSMSALAALPVIGELAKAAADITKSIAPLIQPFADVAAKTLGDTLKNTSDEQSKSIDFDTAKKEQSVTITFS